MHDDAGGERGLGPEAADADLERYRREVYSLLMAITRNPVSAEDLAQEVFVVAARKGMTAGPETRLWFREVARRLAMNELRRKRPLPVSDLEHTVAAREDDDEPAFDRELAALRACLAQLPDRDRSILAERYERDRSLADLSDEVGQTVGYLKQRFFRLRRQLEGCIRRRLARQEASHA